MRLIQHIEIILKIKKLSDPAGARTQDPYIKSVLLYQLSYGILSTLLFFIVILPAKVI